MAAIPLNAFEALKAIKNIVALWLSGKTTNESAMKEVAAITKKAT